MRLVADSNIVVAAVEALRALGHDVQYIAERAEDPGDLTILNEARESWRVLLTKDHDIGALVFKDRIAHAGVMLLDDLGSATEETSLICEALATNDALLVAGAFIRAGKWGSRVAAD